MDAASTLSLFGFWQHKIESGAWTYRLERTARPALYRLISRLILGILHFTFYTFHCLIPGVAGPGGFEDSP